MTLSAPTVFTLAQSSIQPTLVLASASPRRRDLLAQIGIVPAAITPAAVDERPHPRELPRALALRLAEAKARLIAAGAPAGVVLAADTVVARGRRILPKPEDLHEARRCLVLLSGARHRVYGGIAVAEPSGRVRTRLAITVVAFKRLGEDEIEDYLASGEWQDKAGGYAIQGRAAVFVRQMIGSYSNVVGLPLFETAALLRAAGIAAPPPAAHPPAAHPLANDAP